MKVTNIKIGRVHNLGNYEHIRYELTVAVGENESASSALVGMENILTALNPKRPANVPEDYQMNQMAREIEKIRSLSPEDFETHHGWHNVSQSERIAQMLKDLSENKARKEAWESKRDKARGLLDDIGGAAVYKDAKDNWGDDN